MMSFWDACGVLSEKKMWRYLKGCQPPPEKKKRNLTQNWPKRNMLHVTYVLEYY
jgi:hypothetical protein